jgi:hypothetical protein
VDHTRGFRTKGSELIPRSHVVETWDTRRAFLSLKRKERPVREGSYGILLEGKETGIAMDSRPPYPSLFPTTSP